MNRQFISDSAAKGAAYLDQKDSNKNTDTPISAGNTGNAGNKTKEVININVLSTDDLLPQAENAEVTRGNKPPFELIEYKKGFRNGVYHIDATDEGAPKTWICDPLKILAETRDSVQQNWGRLLSWRDGDDHLHQWVCPAELLQATDQSEFRRVLAGGGLVISTNQKARKLLCDYVLTHKTDMKARCVDKIGWNGSKYVLNTRVIGTQDKELLVYQGNESVDFSTSGTLKDWQGSIAALATGNSRITFAISCAVAGALVELAGESGGGFQFTGETSKGKTSALMDPAASVWGHPEHFSKKWRATVNGLEAVCLARNHNVLILDDLGQIEPAEAGQAAYLIANGQARQRMQKDTSARRVATWKTMLLSSGEIDLSRHIESVGKKAKGGQIARLPSIPADTGSGQYAIEELHGCTDGREFSGKIKGLARQYYGTAGIAFLEAVALDYENIAGDIKDGLKRIIKTFNLPAKHAPEAGRIAERFALVAYSGELATRYSVTGWAGGSATNAAKACFDAWYEQYGGAVGHEETALLNQVSAYIQAYGGSRFPSHDATSEGLAKVHIRSGFIKEGKYLVETGAFRNEICKGFDLKFACRVLIDRGWLIPGSDKAAQTLRIQALGKVAKVYVIDAQDGGSNA